MCNTIEQLDESTECPNFAPKKKKGRPSIRNFTPPDNMRVFGKLKNVGQSIRLEKYVTKPAKNIMAEKGYKTLLQIDYFIEPGTIISFTKDNKRFVAVAITRLDNRTNLLIKENS